MAAPQIGITQDLASANDYYGLTSGITAIPTAVTSLIASVVEYFGGTTKSPMPATHQVVRIYFATDRSVVTHGDEWNNFTADRSENGTITYGSADVSIPRDHRMGAVEQPSLLRLEFKSDPEAHVMVLKTALVPKDLFMKELAWRINRDPKKEALIFVHGFHTPFEEAVTKLGQISYDLGFKGAPILYSWASAGRDSRLRFG